MDSVGEQRHAARKRDDQDLQRRHDEQPHERPLDGSDALLGGSYRRVHRAVAMVVIPMIVMVVSLSCFARVLCHGTDCNR
jgi:hypothetical protein